MQTIQYSDFIKRYDVNFRAKPNDEDFVGAGGFGYVYKGYDKLKHTPVAIKRSATDKNLLDEVEKAKQLPQHVNIARYLEGFRIETEADDFDVAILQYYPKGNLNQLIASRELNDNQIHDLVLGILEGISFLHKGFTDFNGKHRSIIHRDLKPQNILIAEYKGTYTPLITDFGISKLVKTEDIHSTGGIELSNQMGTMMYKAPEQVLGGTVRSNLDLWAFGIILFKMLTGKLPFDADTQMSTESVLNKITKSDLEEIFIQLEDYPKVYQQIIRKCLVRDIKTRVQTADDLIGMLRGSVNVTEEKNEKNTNYQIFEEKTDDRNDLKENRLEIPLPPKPVEEKESNDIQVVETYPRLAAGVVVAVALVILLVLSIFWFRSKSHIPDETTTDTTGAGIGYYGVQTVEDYDSPNPNMEVMTSDSLVNVIVSAIKCPKNPNCSSFSPIILDEVYFENNSPALKKEASEEQMYRIIVVMEAYPKLRMRLIKTVYEKDIDNHGKKELWIKRLESVKKSMIENGVEESRILLRVDEKYLEGIVETDGIAIEI